MSPENSIDLVAEDLPFEDLVHSLRVGDEGAWTRVFDKLQPRATEAIQRAFGNAIARPENAGGEAVASACRSIYRNIRAGKFELNNWNDLAGLFVRIATNKCVDNLRREQRQLNLRGGAGEPSGGATPAFDPVAPGGSPADVVIRAEALREFKRVVDLVQRRLKRIDPSYAEIFKLRLHGTYTSRQIARIVGRSEAIVKRAWEYATEVLKSLFDESFLEHLGG